MTETTNQHEPLHPGPSPLTNFVVLVILMLLLAATCAVALIDVDRFLPGGHWGVGLALLIAAMKAALVIAYFMHVRYGSKTTGVFAIAGFVWLGIMIVLVSTDYIFAEQAAPLASGRALEIRFGRSERGPDDSNGARMIRTGLGRSERGPDDSNGARMIRTGLGRSERGPDDSKRGSDDPNGARTIRARRRQVIRTLPTTAAATGEILLDLPCAMRRRTKVS